MSEFVMGQLRYRIDHPAVTAARGQLVLEVFDGEKWVLYNSEDGLRVRNHLNRVLINHLGHPWPPT